MDKFSDVEMGNAEKEKSSLSRQKKITSPDRASTEETALLTAAHIHNADGNNYVNGPAPTTAAGTSFSGHTTAAQVGLLRQRSNSRGAANMLKISAAANSSNSIVEYKKSAGAAVLRSPQNSQQQYERHKTLAEQLKSHRLPEKPRVMRLPPQAMLADTPKNDSLGLLERHHQRMTKTGDDSLRKNAVGMTERDRLHTNTSSELNTKMSKFQLANFTKSEHPPSNVNNVEYINTLRGSTTEYRGGSTVIDGVSGMGETFSLAESAALSRPIQERRNFFEKLQNWIVKGLMELFGSEMDFDTAYSKAKGKDIHILESNRTNKSDTGGAENVRATEHICFFPLRFKDSLLETEYGEVCGQLFVGRDFLVLSLTSFVIIPITWYLASACFSSIELNEHSKGAWIAFHCACAVDLTVSLTSLLSITIPKLANVLHKHYEIFSYLLVFLWMSVLLIVLAIFPRLVMTPPEMDVLFNFSKTQIAAEVKKLSPTCRRIHALPGLAPLLAALGSNPTAPAQAIALCMQDSACNADAVQMGAFGIQTCQNEIDIALGVVARAHGLKDLWLPFAYYVYFVKQTLQTFKIPTLALGVILIHFGTGMMFMDSLSPSRTKFTIFLHIIVIPVCAMPFILLRIFYPTLVPIEEACLFCFSFFFVAMAGYLGRYAQEFQHRLLFCSWRLTTKKLNELHDRMKSQKKSKKSSTAIEELISQVKECQTLCTLASSRGRRADVTEELLQMEKILTHVLEVLTRTENLYSVRFTDEVAENELERQFIELYNKPTKKIRKLGAKTSMRSSALSTRQAKSKASSYGTSGPTFGSVTQSTLERAQNSATATSPVVGFEFGLSFQQQVGTTSGTTPEVKSFALSNTSDIDRLSKEVVYPERTNVLLGLIGVEWEFDMLRLSAETESVLLEVGYTLLSRLVFDWSCDDSCLIRFLLAIQHQYLPNPYHNQIHGAEVAHLTDCLMRMLNAQRGMNSVDKVTLTLSALCHDVGHPGRNNQFFVNSYDPLAVIYNDVAVLENFHSCLTFRTLENKDCNLFFNLDDGEFRFVRQNLIECILATDMKQHFESISRFRVRRLSPEFNYVRNAEDRWLLARMCIKVADIGHSSVPWQQHFDWSLRVVEEFYQQGEEELARGLPLSPLCDKEKHADLAKSQGGFLEFVVKPLLKEFEDIDPLGRLKTEVIGNMEANQKRWMTLQEQGSEIALRSHTHPATTLNTVTSYAVRKIAGIRSSAAKKTAVTAAAAAAAKAAAAAAAEAVDLPAELRRHLEEASDEVHPSNFNAAAAGADSSQEAVSTAEGSAEGGRPSDFSAQHPQQPQASGELCMTWEAEDSGKSESSADAYYEDRSRQRLSEPRRPEFFESKMR